MRELAEIRKWVPRITMRVWLQSSSGSGWGLLKCWRQIMWKARDAAACIASDCAQTNNTITLYSLTWFGSPLKEIRLMGCCDSIYTMRIVVANLGKQLRRSLAGPLLSLFMNWYNCAIVKFKLKINASWLNHRVSKRVDYKTKQLDHLSPNNKSDVESRTPRGNI